jgi:hypothetical protein
MYASFELDSNMTVDSRAQFTKQLRHSLVTEEGTQNDDSDEELANASSSIDES